MNDLTRKPGLISVRQAFWALALIVVAAVAANVYVKTVGGAWASDSVFLSLFIGGAISYVILPFLVFVLPGLTVRLYADDKPIWKIGITTAALGWILTAVLFIGLSSHYDQGTVYWWLVLSLTVFELLMLVLTIAATRKGKIIPAIILPLVVPGVMLLWNILTGLALK